MAKPVESEPPVLIHVIDITAGREISWNTDIAEKLRDRVSDIRNAIVAAAQAVDADLDRLPDTTQWRLGEVSASFGITLAAEAGVILARASTQATFDVTLKYLRK